MVPHRDTQRQTHVPWSLVMKLDLEAREIGTQHVPPDLKVATVFRRVKNYHTKRPDGKRVEENQDIVSKK